MIIQARSPYIIEVDEVGQLGSKIELFIWNGSGAAPVAPTYKFSKLAPTATNTANYYNISPYIREYIDNTDNQNVYNVVGQTDYDQYANVKVIRYKLTGAGYTVLDTTNYYARDGWGYYEDGTNPDNGDFFLDEKTYYYWYDPSAVLATDPLKRAGFITIKVPTGGSLLYTNLVTGFSASSGFGTGIFQDVYRVRPAWYSDGNQLDILDSGMNTVARYKFRPITECRYDVVTIDFINKYGAWQREFMFKASFDSIEVKTNPYQLMPTSIMTYNPEQGVTKEFNINGQQTIKVNTGWVQEDFKENLTQLALSERILLNGLPVTLKTKGLDRIKAINKKDINYTLEFLPAYEIINNVL